MTDKEWFDNLRNASISDLIKDLEWFNCDPYYKDMWIAVIDELKRRVEGDK